MYNQRKLNFFAETSSPLFHFIYTCFGALKWVPKPANENIEKIHTCRLKKKNTTLEYQLDAEVQFIFSLTTVCIKRSSVKLIHIALLESRMHKEKHRMWRHLDTLTALKNMNEPYFLTNPDNVW